MFGMSKRNFFLISSKYQMQTILLLLSPLFVIALALTVVSYVLGAQVDRLLAQQSFGMVAGCIAQWFYITVCFIYISLITFVFLAFKFAQDLVNPFPRILKEVDAVLAGGAKKVIIARPEDELANDVLKRVNDLISRMK